MITIITSRQPFQVATGRLAQSKLVTALKQFGDLDLEAQASGARRAITLSGVTTYWTEPFTPGLPPYILLKQTQNLRVFLLGDDNESIGVYDGAKKDWERRAIGRSPEWVHAVLPKRAFGAPDSAALATPRQLSTIRRVLNLAPDFEIPPLHIASASRLLDCVTFEKILPELVEDFSGWLTETLLEDAA